MDFMEQVIVATKQEIIDGAGITQMQNLSLKCVHRHELEVMKIPRIGFITYRYYVFSGFRL